MEQLLRFGWRAGRLGSLLLGGLCLVPAAWAQDCPKAATCTPGAAPAANQAFGFGIVKVTLGALSNATAVRDGYQDYSCRQQANLLVGRTYPLTVQTSAGGPENVRVWLDYNNDGAFSGANELVFSSDNQILHVGAITAPAAAPLGVPLRLRVAADYANAPVPTACGTPEYSQTEDYAVVLAANPNPPVAAFAPDAATTCAGDRSTARGMDFCAALGPWVRPSPSVRNSASVVACRSTRHLLSSRTSWALSPKSVCASWANCWAWRLGRMRKQPARSPRPGARIAARRRSSPGIVMIILRCKLRSKGSGT